MSVARSSRRALGAGAFVAVVACTATTPPPGSTPPAPTIASAPSPSSVGDATPPADPARTERPARDALELDVGRIDPDLVWPMLEFASDGRSIIWSSGVLDGPGGSAAPDLWRQEAYAGKPELLWRNPERERQLAKIGGDGDVWAFAEISSLGERWWKLWVLTDPGGKPILLDRHPGDEDIPSLVPSFDVDAGRISWSSFDRGPDGPVTQLWLAEQPDWEPRLLVEADADERALWLPSLYGHSLAYVDVTLGVDPAGDIRHVLLLDLDFPETPPVQLDMSGNATMPIVTDDAVIWKEPDEGFAMFNWGRLYRYDIATGAIRQLRIAGQDYVNYPSGGGRFVAMWGADSSRFSVYDIELERSRLIAHFDDARETIRRPHVAGDLLVWLRVDTDEAGEGEPSPIEYAWLPAPGSDRLRD